MTGNKTEEYEKISDVRLICDSRAV